MKTITAWPLSFIFALITMCANCQNTILDSTFSDDGIFVASAVGEDVEGRSVVVLDDSKLLILGHSWDGEICVYKCNEDGSPDTGFGTNGCVRLDFPVSAEEAKCMLVQSDGDIVISGTCNDSLLLLRLLPDGTYDPTFNGTGKAKLKIGANYTIGRALAMQTDEKIVVVGSVDNTGDADFVMVRYNSNGLVDSTFAINGVFTWAPTSNVDYFTDVKIQTDGKIVVSALYSQGYSGDFAVMRFKTNGERDSTFSADGLAFVDFSTGFDEARGIDIQADSKILIGGTTTVTTQDFAAARLMPDGSIDASFGSNGKKMIDFDMDFDEVYTMVMQPDGKLILGGISSIAGEVGFGLCRLLTTGQIDNSFGSNGRLSLLVGSFSEMFDMAVQNDGKILVAGTAYNANANATVVRFMQNPSVSLSDYSPNTLVSLFPNPVSDYAFLKLTEKHKDVEIEIYNSTGQRVQKESLGHFESGRLSISVPDGLYYYQVRSQGALIAAYSFVVSNK